MNNSVRNGWSVPSGRGWRVGEQGEHERLGPVLLGVLKASVLFLSAGRRALLLPGPHPRKPGLLCCTVNVPWTSVSVQKVPCTTPSFSNVLSLFCSTP